MPFKHIQLLIVVTDDNPHDHYFIRSSMVGHQGVRFISFFSGQELIDYVSYLQSDNFSEIPDLIIIDINMPGFTGLETIEILQKEYNSNLYFAVLSSGSDLHSQQFTGENVRYYTKPDSMAGYEDVIVNIITDYQNGKMNSGG